MQNDFVATVNTRKLLNVMYLLNTWRIAASICFLQVSTFRQTITGLPCACRMGTSILRLMTAPCKIRFPTAIEIVVNCLFNCVVADNTQHACCTIMFYASAREIMQQ